MSDETVVAACKQAWTESWLPNTPNKDNCSGFVKSVLADLKITGVPNTNADGLCGYLSTPGSSLKVAPTLATLPPEARSS